MDEGAADVKRGDLAAQQVAGHVLLFADAAGLGTLGDHRLGQQAGADAIGIDRCRADAAMAVVDGVLAHQRQRRRLGQAVGAEAGAGVERLLRSVEQQAAAGALRPQDPHRRAGDLLVCPEIELEALAQHALVDVADAALPGGAGVRDDDVDAAEGLDHSVEGGAHRIGAGHVAADGKAA